MALLQTPNAAFTKLSTLLVYLVSEIDRQAAQVPNLRRTVPCQACTLIAVSRGNMHAGKLVVENSSAENCRAD
jgi:hypothetical protein